MVTQFPIARDPDPQPGANAPHLLLVDDDPAITDNLGPFLRRTGFDVAVADDGASALARAADRRPDLIVLDVLLPDIDGRAVLRRLRAGGDWTPVILLTGVGEPGERALALDEGADDYLNKPFDPIELVSRIRAVLRRGRLHQPSLASAERLSCGHLSLDRRSRRVALRGREVVLTPKAVALLDYLMTHPDELLTRERLLDVVWGWDHASGTRAVDSRIAELRRELGDDAARPAYIATETGEGYRFVGRVEAGQ